MPSNRIIIVTAGIMLSLFLASMESTVVATAMPTIVGQLGGLEHYSWVFSAYMLASTTTVPLYGKLSDIYGRRVIYAIAMILFLIGSVMSGEAQSMPQLIFARAVQGVGAGGIIPLAFILIGEMFSLEERTKMQGLFSGVWGVSSIIGPLLGGFIVEQLSWHWVFYINLIPGPLALFLVVFGWIDKAPSHTRPAVDYAGAFVLTAAVLSLLLGLMDFGTTNGYILLAASVGLIFLLVWIENRAEDPVLPIALLRDGLFSASIVHGALSGWAVFGLISFIPLFVQTVLGKSATLAGITITPMLLGWVAASIIGTRLLLKVGYRTLGLIGTSIFVCGSFLMIFVNPQSSHNLIMFFVTLMGSGMGLAIPAFVIAVQTSVERRYLGTATSTLQFARSMGGTLGVSVMGAALSIRLAANLNAAGLDPKLVDGLLDPLAGAAVVVDNGARLALADAIQFLFVVAFCAALLSWVAAFYAPHKELNDNARKEIPAMPLE